MGLVLVVEASFSRVLKKVLFQNGSKITIKPENFYSSVSSIELGIWQVRKLGSVASHIWNEAVALVRGCLTQHYFSNVE